MLVEVNIENNVATVSLNRPEKRNALNPELITELSNAFKSLDENNDAHVIVLKGNGSAFCAGADLKYLQSLSNFTYEENLADSMHLGSLYKQIYLFPKPVIAKIDGHAIAGGCGLVTVCDFAFAVPEAKLGYPEVKIGFVPALVSYFLIKCIGAQKAKQYLLSGELISARIALEIGMIDKVAEESEINEVTASFARMLVNENSVSSMLTTKKLLHQRETDELNKAIEMAAEINAKARETDDFKQGLKNFLEKKS